VRVIVQDEAITSIASSRGRALMMSKGGLVVAGGRTSCDRLSKASLSENEGVDMDGVKVFQQKQLV
jgi:hypothetical protein